jgi:hypothetical protein
VLERFPIACTEKKKKKRSSVNNLVQYIGSVDSKLNSFYVKVFSAASRGRLNNPSLLFCYIPRLNVKLSLYRPGRALGLPRG